MKCTNGHHVCPNKHWTVWSFESFGFSTMVCISIWRSWTDLSNWSPLQLENVDGEHATQYLKQEVQNTIGLLCQWSWMSRCQTYCYAHTKCFLQLQRLKSKSQAASSSGTRMADHNFGDLCHLVGHFFFGRNIAGFSSDLQPLIDWRLCLALNPICTWLIS